MLEYVTTKEYRVFYKKEFLGRLVWRSRSFSTAEDAINFIKGYRIGWTSYRLEQVNVLNLFTEYERAYE